MITYEITATVREDLCEQYEKYMQQRHIPDLLSTGAFESATLSRSAGGTYRVRYEAESRDALDEYLAKHAARLRNHFQQTFPSGVSLKRTEWEVLQSWQADRSS